MDLLNIQYGILSHMIVYPEHVGEVMTLLTAEDFDSLPTRGLFEAISRLHFSGAPVDAVTVLREAGDDYSAAIEESLKHCASDVRYYCGLLREGMQLRRIQGCAYDLAGVPTMEEAEKTISYLSGLVSLRQKTEIVSAHEAAADFVQRMASKQKPEYLSLGMKELDKKLYLELGDFILLGGNASTGKTMLSLQFALALEQKYRVGYFSLETNQKKLTDRLIAHMAQIPLSGIKNCSLEGEDARRAVEAARRLDKLNIDFIRAGGMTVQDIQAVTLSKRYQVIFVDYLQIVSTPGKTRYEVVTNISVGLHALAQSHNVAVFALAQLGRLEKNKDGKFIPPSLSSFKESGQLEQDADAALLLWRADPNNNRSERVLKIAKNKEGERGDFRLAFNGATQTFTPVPGDGQSVSSYYAAEGRKARQRNAQQSMFQPVAENGPTPFDNGKGST